MQASHDDWTQDETGGSLPMRPEALPSREPQPMTTWERLTLARHPERPHTLDMVGRVMSDFVELRGDRLFGDDQAMVGGLARLGDETVMVIGHQKGRDTKDNLVRHFGMPKPEGYRKALRLMKQAEQFGMPVITFIDTPGADPGPPVGGAGPGDGHRHQPAGDEPAARRP